MEDDRFILARELTPEEERIFREAKGIVDRVIESPDAASVFGDAVVVDVFTGSDGRVTCVRLTAVKDALEEAHAYPEGHPFRVETEKLVARLMAVRGMEGKGAQNEQ